VPKSHGRKPARRPARHPRRRGPGPAAQDAGARLTGLLEYGDPADPVQVTALLPLFLDALAADHRLPAERCLDDCVVLAHAYAQLGIAAEVRAAELVITSAATGQGSMHGSLNPRWQGGLIHGHAVVWLPGLAHLADVTAGQYSQIAAAGHGPVIAACTLLPGSDTAGDLIQVEVPWDGLLLAYTLAPLATTAVMLDHPVMRAEEDGHRRRGMNLASAAVRLLADFLPADRARLIPHPRAAALAEAVRDLPDHRTPAGDLRFMLPGPEGNPVAARLDEIPLPDRTPPAADVR
jgi:hypothetical protein